jgi:hypothetical protein
VAGKMRDMVEKKYQVGRESCKGMKEIFVVKYAHEEEVGGGIRPRSHQNGVHLIACFIIFSHSPLNYVNSCNGAVPDTE